MDLIALGFSTLFVPSVILTLAIGVVAETEAAVAAGFLSPEEAARVRRLFAAAGLPAHSVELHRQKPRLRIQSGRGSPHRTRPPAKRAGNAVILGAN